MFNKLLISTSGRRKPRTARFFFGTFVFYSLSVATAFALSIIIANPQLADTGTSSVLMITPVPAPVANASRPPGARPRTPVAVRNDPMHINDLSAVVAMPAPTAPHTNAPAGPPIFGATDPGGPTGDGPFIPGVLPGPGGNIPGSRTDTIAPPPRPIEPQKPAPRVDDNKPVRLTSMVLQGKAIVRQTPDYPPLAKQIRLAGSVPVEIIISPDGRVESARAMSGHPLLATAAVKAAYGWRFGPTLLNGTPVRVTGVIVFNFTLE